MPTYEYACTACNNEWEAEQSMKDPALTECPACKQATAKRQISRGAGFILKGGGWYADLYSGGSNKKAGKSESSAPDKAADAAPAAATPAATSTTPSSSSGSSDSGSST